MDGSIRIRPARPDDLSEVQRLLREASLPLDGLEDQFGPAYAVAVTEAGRIAGAAGVEVYGKLGLLRSAVTDPPWRGQRVMERLVRELIDGARSRGLEALWLLTNTAADYFPRFGFEPVARGEAPAELQASVEFAHACPASCGAMRLHL